jgi:dTMP kinase
MTTAAIAGCDGTGKSTLVGRVAQRLRARGVRVEILDKWDVFDAKRLSECRFLAPEPSTLRQCVAEMEGSARVLFIFWMIRVTLRRLQEREGADLTCSMATG